jgi:hypothetical protein
MTTPSTNNCLWQFYEEKRMKKTIICILFFLLSFVFLNSYELDIIQGEENIKTVTKSKPISVLVTMDHTMHLKGTYDNWLKQYNAKRKDKGEEELDKEQMVKEMRKKLAKGLKNGGRKWKLKLIDSKEEAQDGYILSINIDQVRPIPMVSYTAKYSITAYKVGSDDILFKVKLNDNLIKAGVGVVFVGLPKDSLEEAAETLIDVLPVFLRKGK